VWVLLPGVIAAMQGQEAHLHVRKA
jgi:hypothetical protein